MFLGMYMGTPKSCSVLLLLLFLLLLLCRILSFLQCVLLSRCFPMASYGPPNRLYILHVGHCQLLDPSFLAPAEHFSAEDFPVWLIP